MSKRIILYILISLLLSSTVYSTEHNNISELKLEQIMTGQKFVGYWPSDVFWSEDSKIVYFDWDPNKTGKDELYAVDFYCGQPFAVTDETKENLPSRRGYYNQDRSQKVYIKNGDIYILNLIDNSTRQITKTNERESNALFTVDEKSIVYTYHQNLYLWNIENGTTSQITDFRNGSKKNDKKKQLSEQDQWLVDQQIELFDQFEAEEKTVEEIDDNNNRPLDIYVDNSYISHRSLSPDQNYILFTTQENTGETKSTIVPDYLTESGYTDELNSRSKVGNAGSSYKMGIYSRNTDTMYYVSTKEIIGILDRPAYYVDYPELGDKNDEPEKRAVSYSSPVWHESENKVIVNITSLDHKDRWIMLLDVTDGSLELIDRQHDDAWIGGPGINSWPSSNLGWMPDNKSVWFQSEVSGYSHLYTVDIGSDKKTALTSGKFEIKSLKMSKDKTKWYFISNEVHPGEWQFYQMYINGGERIRLTDERGYFLAYLSPDESKLALLHSHPNQPYELFLMDNKVGAKLNQITKSTTEAYNNYNWREPEMITYTASDDATVYARLYKPDVMKENLPLVMFVHGAGYLQNIRNCWPHYYREQMFHNFLADNGYLIIDIDYRGSSGYGRDWRTGIYRHMGGKDLDDYVDAVNYLYNEYKIDTTSVGIYGGSYGGFLALMALFTQSDIFQAGAALRPVTDWAHYNHWYTSNILNTPFTDSIAYAKSSPINFAEGFDGALLVCHGMVDRNVHYQGVVRLQQRLIELGKSNWEIASYPAEGHSFKNESSWIDEYKRIFKLFDDNLKR